MVYSVRVLTNDDAARLDAFLAPHTLQAYYMRSNATKGGIDFQGKDYQADYIAAFEGERLVGVLAHSWMGSVQVYADRVDCFDALAAKWRDMLRQKPREAMCFLGIPELVQSLYRACALKKDLFKPEKEDENLYALPLRALVMPELLSKPGVVLRRAEQRDFDLITQWRYEFFIEVRADEPNEDTYNRAAAESRMRIPEGSYFILEVEGRPVAYCGVGGFLPDWQCVGPVWTPPALRNRGYARAVTAGALALLRGEGLPNALLFANKPEAVKAYRAIGFKEIGPWQLDYLKTPLSSF